MSEEEKESKSANLPGMGAPEKMFYKIRDVAKIADVKPHVLRYWESEFPTLNPKKNRSGQRIYTKKDIDSALEIKRLLHDERFSIEGARQRLKKKKSQDKKLEAVQETIDDLNELMEMLEGDI